MSRRRFLAAAMIAVLPLASGCASGQEAATITKPSIAEGDGANLGDIQVRNAHIAPPLDPTGRYRQGESVSLYVTIVNRGVEDDALVSATSPVATDVRLVPAAQARPARPTLTATPSPADEPAEHTEPSAGDDGEHTEPSASAEAGGADSASPTASASATASAAAGDDTTATPAAAATGAPATTTVALPLPVPNTSNVPLLENSPVALQLVGLTEPLRDGEVIEVELRFENAGSVTLQVPVSTGEYYEGVVREREEAPKENKDTGH